MLDKSFGFIGGGRVVKILLGGLKRINKLPEQITISDINEEILKKISYDFPEVRTTNDNKEPAKSDIIFFSLHPPAIPSVLNEISEAIQNDCTFISLAPKITIEKLSFGLRGYKKIIRMIPNAPSIVNSGYNPITFSSDFNPEERKKLSDFLGLFGRCPEVDENDLEAYAIIAAMGPTYFWFQLYQLMDLGKSFGLEDEELREMISEMMTGAIKTMLNSNMNSIEVMDLIPVKPLGDEEENIKNIYQTRLSGLFKKLKS